jgi:hypothetical protein
MATPTYQERVWFNRRRCAVSNYKEPQKQSPTYLQRQSQAWCKVHKERVRSIIKQKKLNKDAKLIYMGLMTYFHDGGGVLIESKDRVAKSLGFERDDLDYCINILVKEGWLEIAESGAIFEPVVYKYITKKEHPDDAESGRIQSDLDKYGRILPDSPGETSALDKIRASSFGGPQPPKERSDSNIQNKKETGKGEGSLELPSLFPFLLVKEVEEVRQEFPGIDFENACSEFLRVNQEKKTPSKKVDQQWFRTFVARYARNQGAATASPGPKSDSQTTKDEVYKPEPARPAKKTAAPDPGLLKLEYRPCPERLRNELNPDLAKSYGWFIGKKFLGSWGNASEFFKYCREMPKGDFEASREYLLGFVGLENWDVMAALNDFSGDESDLKFYDVLFSATNWDDGFEPIEWSGIETAKKEAETEAAIV